MKSGCFDSEKWLLESSQCVITFKTPVTLSIFPTANSDVPSWFAFSDSRFQKSECKRKCLFHDNL